jgi:murein DD-endopeptidase MepM/ murein hydrolase activator NlpD
MKRLGAPGACALLLLLVLPTRLPRRMEHPFGALRLPSPPRTVVHGQIARNATLATALRGVLSPAAIHRLVEAARPVYDLARLSVGHRFGLALGPDGLVAAFTYAIDELRTLRVVRDGGTLVPEVLSRSYEQRTELVSGEIASSLFAAVTEAGEEDQLALDLAEIFAWDVDFNTELQRGDAFRVAVEKLYLDGRLGRYGRILSAELTRGDRTLRAVRYEGPRGVGYYAPDGTPLRKAFLRSPLRFSRITSGFTRRRLHPILGRYRPHLGVDYAAPAGTAVSASADGVVVEAGWRGGFGKTVRLRHANGYQTLYGHLSRIRVRVRRRVAQGDVIGTVGSTGLATGPHLDYRMSRNGSWVNPLTVQLPPAEPLAPDERAAFAEVRDRALALLEAAPRPLLAAAAPARALLRPSPPPRL